MMMRRKTKAIKIGNCVIGANHPIAIQSMAKTKTADIENTIRQIKDLQACGCEIVRVAVKDKPDAQAIKKIKSRINIALVADCHFHWKLAVAAIDNGADKIRLNPGNIYKANEVKRIVSALKSARIPLRVGVNSGSLPEFNSKKMPVSQRLVGFAMNYIKMVEKMHFYDIVVSLKASTVLDTIEAYRQISKLCVYPLHLGVTATGLALQGAVKSAVALGILLAEGIGDTIRISLTDKPQEEIRVAKYILQALGLRNFGWELISCPTCGRCAVDLVKMVKDLENRLDGHNLSSASRPIKLAIMGCVVNGPGEAREADAGVAFGKKEGILFTNGRRIKKVTPFNCIDSLLELIK
jgi:(E)-4-hydroxy-3-methylbut-2-enyl-diphosphate synthase